MNSVIAKERLACVVKPDSVTTTQGDFLATHVAMKKLVLLNKFESVPTKNMFGIHPIYTSLLPFMDRAGRESHI